MAFAAARMILKDRRRKPSGEEFQSPRNRCKNQPRASDGSLNSIREVMCSKNAGKSANSAQVTGANSPSPTSNNAPGRKTTPDSASNKTNVTGKNVNPKANKGCNPTHDLIVTIDLSEHGLTEAQVADFKEAFMLIDKDEDGMITVTELGKVMKSLGQRSTDKELRTLVREVSNDDLRNTVEFNEFLQLMSKKLKNDDSGDELLEAFRVFDKLGDGWIMSTDLRFIMKQLGERLTDVEVDEMLKEADRDNKGRVYYQEFAELLIK